MKLTVAELFAGVGGFRVGLNHIKKIDPKTGKAVDNGEWDIVWANQYEPSTKEQHAFQCYEKRFGKGECSNQDIHLVDKDLIPQHSLLVGGFPCQDYSVARSLSNEKGIEGKKGVLFWDIRDVLIHKKTPFVLLENVDRLLKSPAVQRGRDFSVMLKTFQELGYNVEWRVINAAMYGMPQKRKRVFIFAWKIESDYNRKVMKQSKVMKEYLQHHSFFNNLFPVRENLEIKTTDLNCYEDVYAVSNDYGDGMYAESGIMLDGVVYHTKIKEIEETVYPLRKLVEEAHVEDRDNISEYLAKDADLEKWKYLKGAKKIVRTSKNGHTYIYSEGSMTFPEDMDKPGRTMLTSEGTLNRSSHIIFDERLKSYRSLFEEECELMQMFPPGWTDTMPRRRRYFMMGNALVTGIISRIEPKLKEIISNEKE